MAQRGLVDYSALIARLARPAPEPFAGVERGIAAAGRTVMQGEALRAKYRELGEARESREDLTRERLEGQRFRDIQRDEIERLKEEGRTTRAREGLDFQKQRWNEYRDFREKDLASRTAHQLKLESIADRRAGTTEEAERNAVELKRASLKQALDIANDRIKVDRERTKVLEDLGKSRLAFDTKRFEEDSRQDTLDDFFDRTFKLAQAAEKTGGHYASTMLDPKAKEKDLQELEDTYSRSMDVIGRGLPPEQVEHFKGLLGRVLRGASMDEDPIAAILRERLRGLGGAAAAPASRPMGESPEERALRESGAVPR